MTAALNRVELMFHALVLQRAGENLALTERHHIIYCAVKNDDRHIVSVEIRYWRECLITVGVILFLHSQQHFFRTYLHLHSLATVHVEKVDRARPVNRSIHSAAVVRVKTHVAFEVDGLCAYSLCRCA